MSEALLPRVLCTSGYASFLVDSPSPHHLLLCVMLQCSTHSMLSVVDVETDVRTQN